MFIRLENLKIHYKVTGAGDPILLIHGWGSDIACFSNLREHLSKKFTVYSLDLPGFGLSSEPHNVWSSADYANLVDQFIKNLKIVNPILLGHSLGGKIIAYLVANNLVQANKLILISSSGIKLSKPFRIKFRIYFFKLLKFLANLPIIDGFVRPRLEIYRRRMGSSDYVNASGLMRSILVKVVNENITSILPEIKMPTLLLWGDKDLATPIQAGEIMANSIPNSHLVRIFGSGHFPFLDNWDIVKVELDKFLC